MRAPLTPAALVVLVLAAPASAPAKGVYAGRASGP